MPPLAFVGLVVAIAVLVLIPTRRLFMAGFSGTVLTVYYMALVLMGLLVAEFRGPARYLVPILVIAYIAPFVTARDGLARLRGRGPGGPARGAPSRADVRRPPMKNVTPTEPRPTDPPR
jgi:hypothetical protein